MLVFLLFCSHVDFGSVCLAPIAQPNKNVCNFIGNKMAKTAEEATVSLGGGQAAFKCVSVPKYPSPK